MNLLEKNKTLVVLVFDLMDEIYSVFIIIMLGLNFHIFLCQDFPCSLDWCIEQKRKKYRLVHMFLCRHMRFNYIILNIVLEKQLFIV